LTLSLPLLGTYGNLRDLGALYIPLIGLDIHIDIWYDISMNKVNVTDVIKGLSGLTEAELLKVNKAVVATIRQIRHNVGVTNSNKFNVGDKVFFTSSQMNRVTYGLITKMNRVNAIVSTYPNTYPSTYPDGQESYYGGYMAKYRVPFSMLTLSEK